MKRWLCGVLALLLVLVVAACDAAGSGPDATAVPTAAPPATAAPRDPVQITEQTADIQTVESAEPAPTPTAGAQPPAETPSTGDVPLVPLVGAVGLILLCSAGLVMLRRI